MTTVRKSKATVKKTKKPIKQKKTVTNAEKLERQGYILDRVRIGLLIVTGVIAVFLLLSLFSYHSGDPGWSSTGTNAHVQNAGGAVGAYFADFLLSCFGFFAYVIPLLLVYGLWIMYVENTNFSERSATLMFVRFLGVLVNFTAGSALCEVLFSDIVAQMPQGPGGMLGNTVGTEALHYLNFPGAVLVLAALFCIGLTLYSGGAWIKGLVQLGKLIALGAMFLTVPVIKSWKNSRERAKAYAQKKEEAKIQAAEMHTEMNIQDEVEETIEESSFDGAEHDVVEEPDVTEDDVDNIDDKSTALPAAQTVVQTPESFIEPTLGLDGLSNVETERSDPEPLQLPSHNNEEEVVNEDVNDEEVDDRPIYQPQQSNDVNEIMNLPLSSQAVEEPQLSAAPGPQNKTTKAKPVEGLPSLELLDEPGPKAETVSMAVLDRMAKLVEEKLADFGVKTTVVGVHPGPVITRFELDLAPGVKVSKLTSLSQDLARSLSTTRVRVVEVIPGKPYVGIELPNQNREMVRIKEILSHSKFTSSKSPLTIALGKDIAGEPEVANVGKMPHLLVAGTTGSGKSVGVNAMIISMLYKAGPDDLRMIMIDPKMLELSIYEGIPHLLTPVVTDMKEASNALRWCVKEMDRRYELMAAMGVRNIAGLNEKIEEAKQKGEPLKDPIWMKLRPGHEADAPELEKMPYIVVIADEFADMMMVVGKKVEELIARLAQKARASGIHLILATQRPSVDVVTGLIKANIPTRLSFQVSSRIDSRTIIDQQGAEQLLGHGDMLYVPPGTGMPIRVHGAFVDDDEVHRVVGAWKELGGEPDYIESILATSEESEGGGTDAGSGGSGEKDALYDEAVNIVLESQRASISNVQRRLRIGYNRAARLIEEMEAAGVVSEMQSNGMREVLVRKGPQ